MVLRPFNLMSGSPFRWLFMFLLRVPPPPEKSHFNEVFCLVAVL